MDGRIHCFCGKTFSSTLAMGYHFSKAHEELLPTNDETAKYFGGLPFKCRLCNMGFHEKDTDDHKFHLLIEHQNLLRKNSVANDKIEGN